MMWKSRSRGAHPPRVGARLWMVIVVSEPTLDQVIFNVLQNDTTVKLVLNEDDMGFHVEIDAEF